MDSRELIRHANRLIKSQRGAPKQIDLRRAISAAYYAVFHCFLRTAADDLVGTNRKSRRSSSYALVYRAFDHSNMLRICQEATKAQLPEKLSAALNQKQFPVEIRYAANVFADLQDWRHKADYSPNIRFNKSEAVDAAVRAAFATTQFEAADKEARRLFLLSMLFRIR
jgi:uncharacterized protein (UPF0332 family)